MSVMTLNIFVLVKHRSTFELCNYLILFLSTSGAVSVKAGRILFPLFPVGYKLMIVKVLCSTNGLIVLILRLFNIFFLFLSITAYFMSSPLLPYRIIALLTNAIEGNHNKENAER